MTCCRPSLLRAVHAKHVSFCAHDRGGGARGGQESQQPSAGGGLTTLCLKPFMTAAGSARAACQAVRERCGDGGASGMGRPSRRPVMCSRNPTAPMPQCRRGTRDIQEMSQAGECVGLRPAWRADACQADRRGCWCSGRPTAVGVEERARRRGGRPLVHRRPHADEQLRRRRQRADGRAGGVSGG